MGCSSSRIDEYINKVARDTKKNRYNKREVIELDLVDKYATLLGVHLTEIYDDYLEWEPLED
jgi:hypothetical protein